MSKVLKAGCILINTENQTIALVHRIKQKDYSFPKGHLEENETLKECAQRETAEETKRDCIFLEEDPVYLEKYITPSGEDVLMHYFIAKDIGPSDNASTDTHPTIWLPFDEVSEKLTYPSLKKVWDNVKEKVNKYFKESK